MSRKQNFIFSTLLFSDHSFTRMFERNISEEDIEQVIAFGEIIEIYTDDVPDPSFLPFKIVDGRPLHVVVGINSDASRCTVITLYEPNLSKFDSDLKTRRKP